MVDCLIIIDRDGTLIEKHRYLGKKNNWKSKVSLIKKSIFLLECFDVIFPNNMKIVFSNQTGVALGYFSEKRVKEINIYVKKLLRKKGISIDHWIYSPEADMIYAEEMGINKNSYVKDVSNRKPNPVLLINLLKKYNLELRSFERIIVIGDSEDDKKLAENIDGAFIHIK